MRVKTSSACRREEADASVKEIVLIRYFSLSPTALQSVVRLGILSVSPSATAGAGEVTASAAGPDFSGLR